MNFTFTWILDKFGFTPKSTVDTSWPFPVPKEDKDFFGIERKAPECEKAVAKKATTVAKKKPAAKKVVRKAVRKKA